MPQRVPALTQRNGRTDCRRVQLLVADARRRHTRRNALVQHRAASLVVVVVVVVVGHHRCRRDHGRARPERADDAAADDAVRVMVVVVAGGARVHDVIVGAQLGEQLVLVLHAPLARPQLQHKWVVGMNNFGNSLGGGGMGRWRGPEYSRSCTAGRCCSGHAAASGRPRCQRRRRRRCRPSRAEC